MASVSAYTFGMMRRHNCDGLRRKGKAAAPPGQGKPSPKSTAVTKPLTPAMESFIDHYMVRHNATRAYLDSHPGASYQTAATEGSRLYRDPRVSSAIEKLLADQRAQVRATAKRVLEEAAALAFSNLADTIDRDGNFIAPDKLPRHVGVALKKVKRREILGPTDKETGERQVVGHTVEFEMHDKPGALKLLALHFGVFAEPVRDLRVGTGFAAMLESAAARAREAAKAPLQRPRPAKRRLGGQSLNHIADSPTG